MIVRLNLSRDQLETLELFAAKDKRSRTSWVNLVIVREIERIDKEIADTMDAKAAAYANRVATSAVTTPNSDTIVTLKEQPPWAETPTPVRAPPKEVFMRPIPTPAPIVEPPPPRPEHSLTRARRAREAAQPPLDETGYHVGRPWEDGEGEVES